MKNVNAIGCPENRVRPKARRFSKQAARTSAPPISWLIRDALYPPGAFTFGYDSEEVSIPEREGIYFNVQLRRRCCTSLVSTAILRIGLRANRVPGCDSRTV